MTDVRSQPLNFTLPSQLEASRPTEIEGRARDSVRLMVSDLTTNAVQHANFTDLGKYLEAGDVLVVNTSATIPAALDVTLPNGMPGRLHLSNRIGPQRWIGELRQIVEGIPKRYMGAASGDQLSLPGGGWVQLIQPYYQGLLSPEHLRLWKLQVEWPLPWKTYLQQYGSPIRYGAVEYPIEYYQTIFATQAGSAEMPSAGRPFTHRLVTRLLMQGIQFAPILLHTGVSSLETDESPYPEYFRVPETTAAVVNLAKKQGRRVIAVGTTAVRALESATDPAGRVHCAHGWTDLYIRPERPLRAVDGLLTGFHEPRASHLLMLEALAGRDHLAQAYEQAVSGNYRWHEFGDVHLLL